MSLKAKIEAVIYASEEPVTLSQLIGLLGEEGQVELDAEQASLELAHEQGAEGGFDGDEPSQADEPSSPVEEDAVADEAPEASTEAPEADAPASSDEKKAAKAREKNLREYFRRLLDELISEYSNGDRGLEIREVANGYRLATKPEYHDAVRGFVKNLKPPLKLTLQALETLAVIAYKQPVTAPEISEIRGVDTGGVIGSLITRKLVATGGRKQVIGRPILYKTTKEFLLRFGLKDLNELPSIEEFEKMAGELNDAVQEEIPMDEVHASGESDAVDELHSAAEPTNAVHESVEELVADDSTAPEGSEQEHSDLSDVEPEPAEAVPQADGNSDSVDEDVEDEEEDEEEYDDEDDEDEEDEEDEDNEEEE